MSIDEPIGSGFSYIGSTSSNSADLGPIGAIECLNLTGVFLKLSVNSANSSTSSFFNCSPKLYTTSVGFLKLLNFDLAFIVEPRLGAFIVDDDAVLPVVALLVTPILVVGLLIPLARFVGVSVVSFGEALKLLEFLPIDD